MRRNSGDLLVMDVAAFLGQESFRTPRDAGCGSRPSLQCLRKLICIVPAVDVHA